MNDFNMACFLSAARTKNFSATAKELSSTQQAVSRSIKRIEDELGFPLFIRNSQSMCLSKGGEYYYQWLIDLDQSLNWANTYFNDTSGTPKRFRIAFCDWVGCLEQIITAASRLQTEYPDLSIEYLTGSVDEIFSFLEMGTADIILLPEPATFYLTSHPDTYVSIPFCSAPLYIIASQKYVLPEGTLDRSALASMPLLLSPMDKRMDDLLKRNISALFHNGASAAPDVVRLPNLDSVYTEIMCDLGYTISPVNQTAADIASMHREPADGLTIPIVAMWLQNRRVPWCSIFTEYLYGHKEDKKE